MSAFHEVVTSAVRVTEAVGAVGILAGGAFVLLSNVPAVLARRLDDDTYTRLRRNLGRVILVGLEILIAADIVQTVLVEATLNSVAVLAGVVAIRTALSVSLDVEIVGVLPWRAADAARTTRAPAPSAPTAGPTDIAVSPHPDKDPT